MTEPNEPEHVAVYLRFRRIFGDPAVRSATARKRRQRVEGSSVPFGDDRDPHGISDVLDGLTTKMGWTSPLARSELLASWSEIVGDEIAAHTSPTSIENGVLTVSCDSTAWATQLRLMRSTVTTTIASRYPDAGVESVRFEGPGVPSWKRGPRSIPGRGPRDTYG
ncbi:putative nucleic acid-binding Zn ribbon protein [Microbacteriaceae bacterium SG_E_30_P1]|uniref:Nucleic acid-binding Zn ribbon protein n=1 Tax=Antiquaquibacter oligotrophicus TaxID=2880260 RepID=A0ABT6KR86_9MICO|nr:DciA family protein [Antiquaquibacter oligotrophicus]MDH6182359.1 putative nucleic acid-binding Zn ribbon protein [Antiquaquibacter oligotrophicus]UDF11988.1 DciA family protein [Antiquaquibacter oligotrophicus]